MLHICFTLKVLFCEQLENHFCHRKFRSCHKPDFLISIFNASLIYIFRMILLFVRRLSVKALGSTRRFCRLTLNFFTNQSPKARPRPLVIGGRHPFQLVRRFIERAVTLDHRPPERIVVQGVIFNLLEPYIGNFLRAKTSLRAVRKMTPILRLSFEADHFNSSSIKALKSASLNRASRLPLTKNVGVCRTPRDCPSFKSRWIFAW